MKNLVIVLSIFCASCAQLLNGEKQPVIEKSYKDKIYFTTCSGAVEDWGSCNTKAADKCSKGYKVLNRFESAVGGRRELTFQCN